MNERLQRLESLREMSGRRQSRLYETFSDHFYGDNEHWKRGNKCEDCDRYRKVMRQNEKITRNIENEKFRVEIEPLKGKKILLVESEAVVNSYTQDYFKEKYGINVFGSPKVESVPNDLLDKFQNGDIDGAIIHASIIEHNGILESTQLGFKVVMLIRQGWEEGFQEQLDSVGIPYEIKDGNHSHIAGAFVKLAQSMDSL